MLSKPHRLRRPCEFELTVRRGRRASSATVVVHAVAKSSAPFRRASTQRAEAESSAAAKRTPEVGIVVSKAVGNAVQRNRVKRRLRHAAKSRLAQLTGLLVVIRANPSAGSATSAQLAGDLDRCLARLNSGSR
ncbi:MAG: ribonuclease P protein component [Nocardioidaceae bacterium]|nr:ribonuclease P protein component [Nocardioidaceae bacterium]